MRTRTVLFSTVLLFASIDQQKAQAQAFVAGDNAIGLGIGIGGYYARYDAYEGFRPTVALNYDRGTAINVGPGVLGIGGYLAYTSRHVYNTHTSWIEDERYGFTSFGVRGTYHWNSWHNVENWDVYAGVGLGATVSTFTDHSTYADADAYNDFYDPPQPHNPMRTSLYVGTRYYFTDFFGVYAEFGYDVAFLTGGLQFKF